MSRENQNVNSTSEDRKDDLTPEKSYIQSSDHAIETTEPARLRSKEDVAAEQALNEIGNAILTRVQSREVLTYFLFLNTRNNKPEILPLPVPENLTKINKNFNKLPARVRLSIIRNMPDGEREPAKMLSDWLNSSWKQLPDEGEKQTPDRKSENEAPAPALSETGA